MIRYSFPVLGGSLFSRHRELSGKPKTQTATTPTSFLKRPSVITKGNKTHASRNGHSSIPIKTSSPRPGVSTGLTWAKSRPEPGAGWNNAPSLRPWWLVAFYFVFFLIHHLSIIHLRCYSHNISTNLNSELVSGCDAHFQSVAAGKSQTQGAKTSAKTAAQPGMNPGRRSASSFSFLSLF